MFALLCIAEEPLMVVDTLIQQSTSRTAARNYLPHLQLRVVVVVVVLDLHLPQHRQIRDKKARSQSFSGE